MDKAKKIVEKKSSGDVGFDNAIQKFFPEKNKTVDDSIGKLEMTSELSERIKNAKKTVGVQLFKATCSIPSQLTIEQIV